MHTPPSTPPAPQVRRTPGLATTSLVLGLLSVLLGVLTGLPAIITGHLAHSRIKKDPALTGAGFAIAGLVLGYICSLLSIILGILISISASVTESARAQAASAKLNEFAARLEAHRMIAGAYPTTEQGLDALVTLPTTDPVPQRGKQQFRALPTDPWGNDYSYSYHPTTNTFSLASPGPDGTISTSDDITYP